MLPLVEVVKTKDAVKSHRFLLLLFLVQVAFVFTESHYQMFYSLWQLSVQQKQSAAKLRSVLPRLLTFL